MSILSISDTYLYPLRCGCINKHLCKNLNECLSNEHQTEQSINNNRKKKMFVMASSKEKLLTGEVKFRKSEVYFTYLQCFSIIIFDYCKNIHYNYVIKTEATFPSNKTRIWHCSEKQRPGKLVFISSLRHLDTTVIKYSDCLADRW